MNWLKPKLKELLLSSVVILLPIIYGLMKWEALPARMAIHFNYAGDPDAYAGKALVVIGLPILMLGLQWLTVLLAQYQGAKTIRAPRLERLTMWLIPSMAVILYYATIRISLGEPTDIRRIVVALVSVIFIAMGNYLPTVPANSKVIHIGSHYRIPASMKPLQRFMGYSFVVGGLLLLGSLFFSPLASAVIMIGFIVFQLGLMVVAYTKFPKEKR